jgi:hypothetical protein
MIRTWQLTAILAIFSATAFTSAAKDPKEWIEITKTEHADLAPGGTIHITGSLADLNIEAWDRPDVEVTVHKAAKRLYRSNDEAGAKERLDRIVVRLDRKSPSELSITTKLPSRTILRWNRGTSDLIIEYRIHVPRDCNLVIHHKDGTVLVSGVAGDVEATARSGDIMVVLPAADSHSLKASVWLGTVESDIAPTVQNGLFGQQSNFAPSSPKHKLVLRVHVGSISVKVL